jgi:hypothetical protein
MGKVSAKGVLIGGIADVVATNILAVFLVAYAATRADFAHTPKDQIQAAILAATYGNPLLLIAQVLTGVGCSVFGGYLAARIAAHDELLNGVLSSWLCVAIGLYAIASGKASGSDPMQFADFVAAPVAGWFGGYLRARQAPSAAPRA